MSANLEFHMLKIPKITEEQEVANLVTFMSSNNFTGLNSVTSQWLNDICDNFDVDYFSIQEQIKSS